MSCILSIPLIEKIGKINYAGFKDSLENIFGQFILSSCIDEDDNLVLINSSNMVKYITVDNEYYAAVKASPNFVLDKHSFQIICIFHTPVMENNQAIKKIATEDWNNILVYPLLPGLGIVIFFHQDKTYICSEDSLDCCYKIGKSGDGKDISLRDLIIEITGNKFDIDALDKNLCHYFTIVHNKLKKYINNGICLNHNGYQKEIIYEMSTDNKKGIEVEYNVAGVNKLHRLYFSCLDELLTKLDLISVNNKINKKIQLFGYLIRVYEGPISKSLFTTYKINTDIYLWLMKSLDNFENIYQLYLELYQHNKLSNILPYLSKYSNEIVYRINMSMKTLAKEILNIYHATRKQQNKELYESLTETYKKIIYNLHGIYITTRKKDFSKTEETSDLDKAKSITIHDVYYYIKCLPFQQLKQLFMDRHQLLNNELCTAFVCKNCIFTLTQMKLMFG